MKKNILAVIFATAALTLTVHAHPGATDEYGGHYDHDTGEYHYHHGYKAHQHTNGVCPYDFDDKTGQNSGTSSGSTSVYDGFVRPEHTPEPTQEKSFTVSGTHKNILLGIGVAVALTTAIIFLKNRHEQIQKAIDAANRRRRILEEQNYYEQLLKVPRDPLKERAFKRIPDIISIKSDWCKDLYYEKYYRGKEDLIRSVCDLQYDAVYISLDDSKRLYHSRISCPYLTQKVSAISSTEALKKYNKCTYCITRKDYYGGTP